MSEPTPVQTQNRRARSTGLGKIGGVVFFLAALAAAPSQGQDAPPVQPPAESQAASRPAAGPPDARLQAEGDRLYQEAKRLYEQKDFARAAARFQQAADIFERAPNPQAAAAMYDWIGDCWKELRQFDKALTAYNKNLRRLRLIWGEQDHPAIATGLNNVATCLKSLDRSAAALPKFEEALAMRQRLFLGDHPQVAISLNNMATCLDSLDRFDEALLKYEEALAMAQRLFPGDHPAVARGLNNVAGCLKSLKRSAAALPKYEEALAMRQRLYRGDHPVVADSLNNVADCLRSLDRFAEALSKYEEALAMVQRLFLGDHLAVAYSLNNVAGCLVDLDRSVEALSKYEEVLAMRRRLYRGDHPAVADSLNNVAGCLESLGRSAEALPKFEETLAMRQRLFPGDHPAVARSLNNMAYCLESLGRSAEALPKHEEALAMFQRRFPGDHADVATGLNNVAGCLDSLGRPAEALPKYEEALAMFQRLFPSGHPNVATSLNNVAYCLESLGRSAEALLKHEEALAMLQRLFPGNHPGVATSLNNVAGCLRSLGRSAEALSKSEEALEMFRHLFPGSHPHVATSLNNVAVCLKDLGRLAEALPRHEEALAIDQRLFPGDHPAVAVDLNNVADCLLYLGHFAEALSKCEAALAMQRRLFPGDHPAVATSLNNVAYCLHFLGHSTEALSKYTEALAMARRGGYADSHLCAANLARFCLETNHPAKAIAPLTEAISQIEALRGETKVLNEPQRGAYFEHLKRFGAFDLMVRAQLACGRPDQALDFLERGRARSLLDLLERSQLDPLQRALDLAARQNDKPLRQKILAAQQAFAAAEQRVRELENRRDAAQKWNGGQTGGAAQSGSVAQTQDTAQGNVAQTRPANAADDARARKDQMETLTAAVRSAREELHRAGLERNRLIQHVFKLGQPRTADAIRQALLDGPDQYLLVYSVLDDRALLLLVPPPGAAIEHFPLTWPDGAAVTDASLTAAVDEYRQALLRDGRRRGRRLLEQHVAKLEAVAAPSVAQRGELAAARGELERLRGFERETPAGTAPPSAGILGKRLFDALLPEAAWRRIQPARRVYLVPHAALHRLPFEALVVRDAATAAERRYWLDEGPPLVYGPSGSALLWSRERRADQRRSQPERTGGYEAVVLGDAIFTRPDADAVPVPEAGALVLDAPPDSPARRAGLDAGDVLVGYDGQPVADARALRDQMYRVQAAMEDRERPEGPVTLRFWRGGRWLERQAPPGPLGIEVAPDAPPAALAALQAGRDNVRRLALQRGDGETLAPLPGTRREALAIHKALCGTKYVEEDLKKGEHAAGGAASDPAANAARPRGGAPQPAVKVKMLLGENATRQELFSAAPQARYLHLATHGLADETDALSRSRLALTAPPLRVGSDDGFLYLTDLLDQWRDQLTGCELVVLSACQTQVGRLQRDEGVFALPWGFLFAGVPSVIASLWNVADDSTAELMGDFYARLVKPAARSGESDTATARAAALDPLAAFTAARQSLRQTWPEPYFWAPFIYIGTP